MRIRVTNDTDRSIHLEPGDTVDITGEKTKLRALASRITELSVEEVREMGGQEHEPEEVQPEMDSETDDTDHPTREFKSPTDHGSVQLSKLLTVFIRGETDDFAFFNLREDYPRVLEARWSCAIARWEYVGDVPDNDVSVGIGMVNPSLEEKPFGVSVDINGDMEYAESARNLQQCCSIANVFLRFLSREYTNPQ